jgi:dynein heavy chain, axonemal
MPRLQMCSRLQVLVQEMERYNRLLAVVRRSLRCIAAALEGAAVMSTDLEAGYHSIATNQVPALWLKASYPSLKPLASYLDDLYRRLAMLQSWCASEATPPTA